MRKYSHQPKKKLEGIDFSDLQFQLAIPNKLPGIMSRLIATTIFILVVSAITAQTKDKTIYVGNVISDTTTFRSNDYRTALTSILKSENKIEIRFITSPSFENRKEYKNYTVLTFTNKWSAKYYYYKPDTNNLLSKDLSAKTSIDTIFSRLVSNNVFSLPDQGSLKTEKYAYNPETNEFIGSRMEVADGTCYYIEFKVGDLYRRYSYCNPNRYAEFYPQVYELRNFANIVEIFKACTKE
jgi:hypothetical protein